MFKHMFPRKGDVGIVEKPAPIGFLFEPKLDGTRVFVYKNNENITIVNSLGIDISFKFLELSHLQEDITAESCVLDGILTVYENGILSSEALQSRELAENPAIITQRSKKNPATFLVFDILEVNHKPLADEWLRKRKEILNAIIQKSDIIQIVPSKLTGRAVWEEAKNKNYEGLIAKSSSSKYEQGKSWSWLEIANIKTIHAFIAGLSEDLLLLGTYKNGAINYIGEVKKPKKISAYLNKKIKTLKTKDKIGEFPRYLAIKPEIVLKLQYESFKNNQIKDPKILRICFNKLPTECILE